MPDIQIGHHQFHLADPYQEGHRLTASEAKALNILRGERIRNNLQKMLAKLAEGLPPGATISGENLAQVRARAKDLDVNFEFTSKEKTKNKPYTLDGMIAEIARERAEIEARRVGREHDVEAIAQLTQVNLDLPDVIDEARLRLEARAKVARAALEDLLGEGDEYPEGLGNANNA